jgi:hypothetical protein
MNVIRPGFGKVPRGTLARIWRHPFEMHELEAIAAGQKRQFRVRVTAGNSARMGKRRFLDLDLSNGKAETYRPHLFGGLHCHVRDEHPPRIVVLKSSIAIGDVIYPGAHFDELDKATESMLVTEVYPQRLMAISEEEARLEGVVAAWSLKIASVQCAGTRYEVRGALTEAAGARNLKHWRRHEERSDELTDRNLFALDYLRRRRCGYQWWRLNPWVWVIGFEHYAVRPCDLISRLATQTIERKRA